MRAAVVLATLALLASSSLADVDDAAAPSPARAPNPGEDPASTSGPGGFPTKTDVSLMRWISAKGGAFVGVGVYSFVAPGDADDSGLTDARYGSRAMYAKDADVTNGAEVFRIPTDAVMTAPSEAAARGQRGRVEVTGARAGDGRQHTTMAIPSSSSANMMN